MSVFRRFLVAVVAGVALTACASTLTKDIKVEAESNPGFDISQYKTYAWLGSAQVVNDPQGQWEPPEFDADSELRWLMDRELRGRGMSEVTRNPDLIIAFAAGVDMAALELKEDPRKNINMLQRIPKGALVVLFIDGNTGNPVWAGSAIGNIHEEISSADVKKRLDYAVTRMFDLLPAGGESKSPGRGY